MFFMLSEESKNLTEKAYILIKNMVFSQRIVPGQKLIYRELSTLLKMSTTPVQLALARLEQEGFVELIPNVGYFVRKIVPKEVEDLFDIRQILEVHAVKLAIMNQTDESMKILKDKILEHKNYVIDIYDRKKLLLDAEVHLQIARMSNNGEIVKQLQRIHEHIYLRSRIELLPPKRMRLSPSHHEKLFQLIKSKDIEAAQELMKEHIQGAKELMLSTLSQGEQLISFTSREDLSGSNR
jgi:DNA-binding GntR family transcriptional regulator